MEGWKSGGYYTLSLSKFKYHVIIPFSAERRQHHRLAEYTLHTPTRNGFLRGSILNIISTRYKTNLDELAG